MLAYIPYISANELVISLFGVPLDPWSLLVSLGFIVGLEVGRARAIRLGLDIRDIVDGALFIIGTAFVFGHWVHVLAYNPHQIDEHGWIILLKIWAGFSSNGGMLGAIIATIVWFRWIRPRPFWLHADTVAFGFPFGFFFGRMGCFTAHDHIGQKTDFFLAVQFPNKLNFYNHGVYPVGVRHDLGLYEALYLVVICVVFWSLRKKTLPHSFFAMLFCFLYAPVRFGLDFLRHTDLPNPDVRWLGLTPAQYGSIILLIAGCVLASRLKKNENYQFVTTRKKNQVKPQDVVAEDVSETIEQEQQLEGSHEEQS